MVFSIWNCKFMVLGFHHYARSLFKDVIIHDGIVMPYGVTLGKNMSDQSKEIYLSAKSNNEIIRSVTQEKP